MLKTSEGKGLCKWLSILEWAQCENFHDCYKAPLYKILWVWPISLLSPLFLPTGFWTKWPWWQVWALSQGCPEGQSHCLLLNAQNAKKKSKPFALMVTDYTRTARSHWSSKILTVNIRKKPQLQACATAHEKAQVTARAQKAEEYEKSSSVLESIQGTSFAQLDLTCNRPVAPVSNCHRHTHILWAFWTGMSVFAFPPLYIRKW